MPETPELAALFCSDSAELGRFSPVEEVSLPEAYQSLLAHHDHMTVTIEAWYNRLVDLRVLSEVESPDFYARMSLLSPQGGDRAVQLGIMRLRLSALSDAVRREIEGRELPLGRILIRHHVMREVELTQLWRVSPGPKLRYHLGVEQEGAIYARTARIVVEGSPAVELLEIVAL